MKNLINHQSINLQSFSIQIDQKASQNKSPMSLSSETDVTVNLTTFEQL